MRIVQVHVNRRCAHQDGERNAWEERSHAKIIFYAAMMLLTSESEKKKKSSVRSVLSIEARLSRTATRTVRTRRSRYNAYAQPGRKTYLLLLL